MAPVNSSAAADEFSSAILDRGKMRRFLDSSYTSKRPSHCAREGVAMKTSLPQASKHRRKGFQEAAKPFIVPYSQTPSCFCLADCAK